jgi:hypothetical protein
MGFPHLNYANVASTTEGDLFFLFLKIRYSSQTQANSKQIEIERKLWQEKKKQQINYL